MQRRILILGGTGDGVALGRQLGAIAGIEAIVSLAGRTRQPRVDGMVVRTGGFGGVAGLIGYLQTAKIDALIDATHPFAQQISWHGARAAAALALPHLLLDRPPWLPVSGDRWVEVPDIHAAVERLPALGRRIFLSTGRQDLAAYGHLRDRWFLMRAVGLPPAAVALPPGMLLCDRGPFSLAAERSLLRRHRIDAIVSKNSGGAATYAKIAAARELRLPVLMLARPPLPPATRVATVDDAIAWVERQMNRAP